MKEPINSQELKRIIPFKWRIQSFSKNYPSATCVAYIDARDVMDLLDEVVGPENWQSDYKEIKRNLYSGIGVKMDGEWVWKWDCGTEPFTEKAKGEASDAFKRAAVKWGIGRFLYDLPIQYVKTSEIKRDNNYPFPVTETGQKVQDLTNYLNESSKVSFIVNHLFDNNQASQKSSKKANKTTAKNTQETQSDKAPEQKQPIPPPVTEPDKEKELPASEKTTLAKVSNIADKQAEKEDRPKVNNNTKSLPNWLISLFSESDGLEKLKENKERFLAWTKTNKKTFIKDELDELWAYHYDRIEGLPYSHHVK